MLYWGGAVAATTEDISAVYQDHANESTAAVAITPGGIGEMYLGYPQPGCFQDEEYGTRFPCHLYPCSFPRSVICVHFLLFCFVLPCLIDY